MSENETHSQKVLYKDLNVQINEKSVKVLKFYFPQEKANEIQFKDINKLGLKEMDEMDEALGVSPSFFEDFKQKVKEGKNKYIEMTLADESVRLCFAPDDPVKVLKLIEQKWQQAKKQQGGVQKALQQNTLYTNVEVTAEKIQHVMEQLKKSEQDGGKEQGMKKRSIELAGIKTVQPEEGQTPKKKVKEVDEKSSNRAEMKENIETK